MIVDFPAPEGPTSAVTVPGVAWKETWSSTALAAVVGEANPIEHHLAGEGGDRHGPPRIGVLRPLPEHFAGPLQTGQRLGQLRPDAHHLEDRRHHERQQRREGHKPTQGQRAREDLPRANVHHHGSHGPHEQGGRQGHTRGHGHGLEDIVEQAPHAAGEDRLFPGFRVIPLDHPHTSERFDQAAGHLGVDLAPRAEDGPDRPECPAQDEPECQDEGQGQPGEQRADPDQDPECKDRCQQPAEQLDRAGPDQVPHALDVGHDAGHHGAALVRVVIGNGQAPDVRLHFLSQLRNEPLGGLGQQLGQRERGHPLQRRGEDHRQHEQHEPFPPLVANDVVDQELGGGGEDQPREAIDHHQPQTGRQQTPARANQLPDQRP